MPSLNQRIVGAALSAAALIGLAMHEGFKPTAYDDGVGVKTIGFGTTEGVKAGDTITAERALVRLGADVGKYEQRLRACIGPVPMYQYEWDAVVSWSYNVGTGAACGSTLVKKLQAFDYTGACRELLKWNRAGGQVLRGLTVRREAEYRQCIGEAQ
jgi:lysozyme